MSFVSKTAIAGLLISIAVLLVVQGVVAGFQRDLNENVLGLVPHVYVSSPGGLDDSLGRKVANEVEAVTNYAMVRQAIGLISNSSSVRRVQVIGIDYDESNIYKELSDFITQGNWDSLTTSRYQMIIGIGLANELNLSLEDEVLLTLADASITPLGIFPRQKRFTVSAVINTSSVMDSRLAYVNRDDLVSLTKASTPSNTAFFRLSDPLKATEATYRIYGAIEDDIQQIGTWEGVFGALYNFLQQFKNLLFILIALLVGVAVFNLVSSMVMLVHSRHEDIAVFQTLGGRTDLVLFAFIVTGCLTACIGLVLGGALAWGLGLVLPWAHIWLTEVLEISLSEGFPLHRLSVDMALSDWLKVTFLTLGASLVGVIYPAWSACRLNPVDSLRDD